MPPGDRVGRDLPDPGPGAAEGVSDQPVVLTGKDDSAGGQRQALLVDQWNALLR
jgi:hypothetical protein